MLRLMSNFGVHSKRNRVSDDMIEAFFEDLPNMIIRDETEINTNMDKYYQITKALERNGYNSDILMKEVRTLCAIFRS